MLLDYKGKDKNKKITDYTTNKPIIEKSANKSESPSRSYSYIGRKTHHYPMRNRQTPNVQKHRDTKFNKSFLFQSILEFSKLGLKREKHSARFNRLLKKHISTL